MSRALGSKDLVAQGTLDQFDGLGIGRQAGHQQWRYRVDRKR